MIPNPSHANRYFLVVAAITALLLPSLALAWDPQDWAPTDGQTEGFIAVIQGYSTWFFMGALALGIAMTVIHYFLKIPEFINESFAPLKWMAILNIAGILIGLGTHHWMDNALFFPMLFN